MNIRKLVYIVKDQLKNGSLNANLADLTSQFNHFFPAQPSRLQAITQYAVENTPYYDTYKKYNDFKDYPVLDKSVIKRNYDDFISIPYKDCIDSLHKVTTSGSYGTPFTFYLNREKREKVISEVYYFGQKSKFDLGVKHAYFMSKTKGILSQLLQNQVMFTVGQLDDIWCRKTINKLKKKNIKILIGYPSAISTLANYVFKKQITIPIEGIITTSEVLTEKMRNQIIIGFQCNPISRYSSEEFGVLANQDSSGNFFWLNQCNFLIEILELDSNMPVNTGELGRIVITDLYNKSMPLIRYDIGDLAIPIEFVNGIVTKVESIEGRKLALIRTVDGINVSPFTINGALRDLNEIIQFQFSQEGQSLYYLKVIANKNIDEHSIISKFRKILGSSADIRFEYLEDIPPQASGKRPYILQNFYNE